MEKKKLFLILSGLILVAMVIMSRDWAPSNDEVFQIPYGNQALSYYLTLGSNDSVLNYQREPLMKNYGALIDMVPDGINRAVGGNLMTTRHMFIAFFSFFYIFFGSLIAKRISGYSGAFFAMALLVFLPRIFGEAMNNPKDPPFAASYIFSIYTFMVFFDSLPKPTKRDYIILGLGFFATMLVRVSGLMAVFYFGLFLLWELYYLKKENIEVDYKKIGTNLVITGFVGYFASVLFWPSMMNNPIFQPIDALKMLQQYPITLRNLFGGKYIFSNEVPWNYNLKYMLMTNPEITLLGIGLGFVFLPQMVKKYNGRRIALLLFASLFPIFYIIYKKTSLLTGWRHSYFTFIPLVVFAGITYAFLYQKYATTQVKKYVFIGLFALGLLPVALFMVRNYKMFYTYFNSASGGMKGAMGNYEIDYYSHSLKPATDWMVENIPNIRDTNLKIVSNNPYQMFFVFEQHGIKHPVDYVRYRERYDTDWDYGVFTQSFVDPYVLQSGYYQNNPDVVKIIEIDGAPASVILKRGDKNDVLGKRALDSNRFPEAIGYLTQAVTKNPYNEIAWANLAMAQLQSGNPNEAINSANKALAVSPENFMAKNIQGYAYLNLGNANAAQYIFLEMIASNPNNPEPYRILAQIYQQQGNMQAAQEYNGYYQQLTGGK